MIFIGADHGGFQLKEQIKDWLVEWQKAYEDVGAFTFNPTDDYPEFAFKVAQKVAERPDSFGILACRSAIGMAIAANKVKGIRAGAVYTVEQVIHLREQNNANVISMSGDWTNIELAKEIIKTFLETKFSNEERHIRRLEEIAKAEL